MMRLAHPQKIAEAQKRLFRVALQHRWMITGIVFISILSGLLILIQMFSLSILIDAAFLKEWVPDTHWTFFYILVAAIMIRSVTAWVSSWLGMRLAIRLKMAYRKRLLCKIHEIGPIRLKQKKAGELIGLHLHGIEKLDDFFSIYIPAAIRISVIPFLIFAVVIWIDWPSGLVFLITGPLIPLFMYLIGTQAGEKIKEQWSSFRRMNAHFLDTIQGMDTIKLFGREKIAGRSINHISRRFRISTMRVLKIAFLSGMVLELAASVSTAVVAVEIGVRLVTGMIEFQTGLFVLLLAPEFYLPFRTFGSSHHAGMEGAESGAHLFDLLDETSNINLEKTNTSAKYPVSPLQLRFENLQFSYHSDEKVIKAINLTINHGEIHTITGKSGEGKTTLLNLIAKLIPPDSGSIFVNDFSLDETGFHDWRNQIAFVPQFPHFFQGSIIDNIRFGKQNASDNEVFEAATLAYADRFINQLTEGYETILSENGVNLSGGELQRIALARVFLKRPSLLLLDEPCASLNEELESVILNSLKKFSQNRIVIIASHKPGTILKSDRLSILKNGEIVSNGTPAELLPFYQEVIGFDYE